MSWAGGLALSEQAGLSRGCHEAGISLAPVIPKASPFPLFPLVSHLWKEQLHLLVSETHEYTHWPPVVLASWVTALYFSSPQPWLPAHLYSSWSCTQVCNTSLYYLAQLPLINGGESRWILLWIASHFNPTLPSPLSLDRSLPRFLQVRISTSQHLAPHSPHAAIFHLWLSGEFNSFHCSVSIVQTYIQGWHIFIMEKPTSQTDAAHGD